MANEQATFEIQIPHPGAQVVAEGVLRYTISVNAELIRAEAAVGTAPVGAALEYTIKRNGTAIVPNALLTVPVSENISNVLEPIASTSTSLPLTQGTATKVDYTPVPVDVASVGDYYTVDVTQIGSSTAGSDAVVILTFVEL